MSRPHRVPGARPATPPSPQPPPDVRQLLRRYGLKPDKALGQNFLVDRGWLLSVVEAADLNSEDTVLEIGAGLGSLTYLLASAAGRVVAVEFDRRLIPALTDALAGLTNVQIVNEDILSLDLAGLVQARDYIVVANIPFNITSHLIRRLLEARDRSRRLVLTVQQEVAERIVSGPGEMSLLALGVHVYGEPVIRARIPADAFYPRPRVESAVLRIDAAEGPRVRPELIEPLFRLARAGFSQKRKKLVNALVSALDVERQEALDWLGRAGLPTHVRAQELSLDSWERLALAAEDSPAGGSRSIGSATSGRGEAGDAGG